MKEYINPDEIITEHRPQAQTSRRELWIALLEITIGLIFGIGEGIIVDVLTAGVSELIPGTEFIGDMTAVILLQKLGVEIPNNYLIIGYACSLIPIVKNFANPATLDGIRRLWIHRSSK